MPVRASISALALVALVLAATADAGQHAGHAPAPHPRPAATHASPGPLLPRAPGAAMPDSVLARVIFAQGQATLGATDYRTAVTKLGGNPDALPPDARRQVLGMLIQQAVLSHRVEQSRPRWLRRDSVNFEGYQDELVLRAALDSALAEMTSRLAARGDSLPKRAKLMTMIRDSALATLRVEYDDAAIDSVAAAYAALPEDNDRLPSERRRAILSALPQVSPAVSARVLGRCEVGGYTARALLADIAALGILKRPTLRTPRAVRDLVDDNLYTMALRREARRRQLDARPDIAAQLAVRRQFLTVQRFVQNEVYDRVPVDTAAVRRYFERDERHYDLGATARIVRLLFARRTEADSAVQRMAQPGYAESLATLDQRPGIHNETTLGEDADTVLFARVRHGGVGAVIGPDTTPDGWRVFKVMSMTPRKPQTLEEAFVLARSDWLEQEGDRRMREMLSKLLAACRVSVNESSSWLRRSTP